MLAWPLQRFDSGIHGCTAVGNVFGSSNAVNLLLQLQLLSISSASIAWTTQPHMHGNVTIFQVYLDASVRQLFAGDNKLRRGGALVPRIASAKGSAKGAGQCRQRWPVMRLPCRYSCVSRIRKWTVLLIAVGLP